MHFNLENLSKKLSLKSNLLFLIKISGLFALCSFLFSITGLIPSYFETFDTFFPPTYIVGNPLEVSGISIEHLLGHVAWGLAIGVATFSVRYFILAGLFPLALDADHLIQFLDLEMIPRFSHSLLFAIVIFVVFYVLFGKKDIRLPVLASMSVFVHISFDIMLGGFSEFPFLIPFVSETTVFGGISWFIIEGISVIPVFLASIFYLRKNKKPLDTNT